MNWDSWLLWGFLSTLILTTTMAASQGLGMTRMNIPYLLGTMFTANRDKAKLMGVAIHLINGWAFSLLYVLGFEIYGKATWWLGSLFGFVQAAFFLTIGMSLLPSMHPRMANEQRGPTVVRQLEPPGFLGLHYGMQTPISIMIAHIIFGLILGGLYESRYHG